MASKKPGKTRQGNHSGNRPAAEKPFAIRTHTLTPAGVEILARLTQDIRDYSGQTISSAAIVRALLRFADQQSYRWVLTIFTPLVESCEFNRGVRWGGKKA
jgi:hypothetical protein